MKTLLTFALLALIGLLHQNSAAIVGPGSDIVCCVRVINRRIPLRRIQNVEWTHSSCPVRAIIVTTARGKRICLDGSLTWVRKILTEFEKSTPAPFNISPQTE